MDKLDLILLELKEIKVNQEKMQSDMTALRTDNRGVHRKLDMLMQTTAINIEEITMLKAK
jgi:hypothetical protein